MAFFPKSLRGPWHLVPNRNVLILLIFCRSLYKLLGPVMVTGHARSTFSLIKGYKFWSFYLLIRHKNIVSSGYILHDVALNAIVF